MGVLAMRRGFVAITIGKSMPQSFHVKSKKAAYMWNLGIS